MLVWSRRTWQGSQGGCGPRRTRRLRSVVDVGTDPGEERGDRGEAATSDRMAGAEPEPVLVEPGRSDWREWNGTFGLRSNPAATLGCREWTGRDGHGTYRGDARGGGGTRKSPRRMVTGQPDTTGYGGDAPRPGTGPPCHRVALNWSWLARPQIWPPSVAATDYGRPTGGPEVDPGVTRRCTRLSSVHRLGMVDRRADCRASRKNRSATSSSG
jgi:hypothetical protein